MMNTSKKMQGTAYSKFGNAKCLKNSEHQTFGEIYEGGGGGTIPPKLPPPPPPAGGGGGANLGGGGAFLVFSNLKANWRKNCFVSRFQYVQNLRSLLSTSRLGNLNEIVS